jgi:hypothetical protein
MFPVFGQRRAQACIIAEGGAWLGHYHDVEIGDVGAVAAKRLAYLATQAIAVDGPWRRFARNGQTKSCVTEFIAEVIQGKQLIAVTPAALHDSGELFGSPQAVCAGEAWPRAAQPSGRQARAAFAATTAQQCPSTLGFHAGPETVGTLAFDFARLISAFHGRQVSGWLLPVRG